MQRVLEPEVMDTEEEAEEYDAMDHGDVNRRFCEDLLAHLAGAGAGAGAVRVADIGTGTALIPIQLCRLHPRCRVVAADLAEHMLARARQNVKSAGFSERIELVKVDAKASHLPHASFDVVMSNSIVHHIPDPRAALADMLSLVAPGGVLFVRDLERPNDDAAVRALVERYAKDETKKARDLFEASLRAALTVDELAQIVAPLGIAKSAIARTSDRHWTLAHRKSA